MSNYLKKELRERVLELLRNQDEELRAHKSKMICSKLLCLEEFKIAKTILFYASFNGEVSTFEMIEKAQNLGKEISFPRILKDNKKMVPIKVNNVDRDLVTGAFGVKEPIYKNENVLEDKDVDLVVVPGVVFDKKNNRIGRGGGFYDRFLDSISCDIPTVGLAFDFQIVDSISFCEKHDMPVKFVLIG